MKPSFRTTIIILKLANYFIFFIAFNLCIIQAQEKDLRPSLPVLEFPSKSNNSILFYITGDGGWNSFSKSLINGLAKKNISIIVLDSRKYFWKASSPKLFAKDLDNLISYYLKHLNKTSYSLAGYSFGADVTSFVPSNLEELNQKKLKNCILISPSSYTDYEIKIMDLLGNNEVVRKYNVQKNLQNTKDKTICIFGKEEKNLLKTNLKSGEYIKIIELPGGHEYEDNFKIIIDTLYKIL